MSAWTVLLPLKQPQARKTRLAPCLGLEARTRLTNLLFQHVTDVVHVTGLISQAILLAPDAGNWPGAWLKDEGRGLNEELRCARQTLGERPLLVIHPDLPLLAPADIEVLLGAAAGGCAVAPDRHDSGTNAIALDGFPGFTFSFGPESFGAHLRASSNQARILRRLGLSLDIDTPEDLSLAAASGFKCQ